MTTFNRIQIAQFELANDAYRNASITFYVVDPVTLVQSTTLATLYDAISGSATLSNPQTLDSAGKFSQPVYVEQACVGVISDSDVENHSTGVIVPPPAAWGGDWESGVPYFPGTVVRDGSNGANTKNFYISNALHESGTWATDLNASKWTLQIIDTAASASAAAASAAAAQSHANFATTQASLTAEDRVATAADVVSTNNNRTAAQAAQTAAEAAAASFVPASDAEVTSGTLNTKFITPLALKGSDYALVPLEWSYLSKSPPEVGDGAARIVIPSQMSGMKIIQVLAYFAGDIATGSLTTIQIHNETLAADVLSTRITIDSNERSSATAATPAVISTSNNTLSTNDVIRLDIDAIGSTTAGTGLVVKALCRKP